MDAVTETMIGFIRSIGLEVEVGEVTEETFVPGITLRQGRLAVDLDRLKYPGDLLHDAGHLAVVTPERRATLSHVGDQPTEEMMAIAWSYAAALHLGIDPAVVFHADGYRGGSESLLENFRTGHYLAVPMLEWTGMAYGPKRAEQEGVLPYPTMQRWLRPAPPPEQEPAATGMSEAVTAVVASPMSDTMEPAQTSMIGEEPRANRPTDIVRLPFTFDPARLQADLAGIQPDEWIPHFNNQIFEGRWSGVALRSVGGGTGKLYSGLQERSACTDTPLLERCPYLREVLDTFQCPLQSARLLKLEPRSHILRHKDPYLGYEEGEVRLHIPIQTDPEVRFYLEGDRVRMEVGECWYLNLSRHHWVDNFSDIPRVHLVIDCEVNAWLTSHFPPGMPEVHSPQQVAG